jgi:thiamine-monophosphate kinase
VKAGRALVANATAMIDSSDGLARSAHQLADASDCAIALETPLPIDDSVDAVAADDAEARELGLFFGEDFELVCTLPETTLPAARDATPVQLTRIGSVVEADPEAPSVTLDGDPLPDRGYTH